jgi:hypothetical protein
LVQENDETDDSEERPAEKKSKASKPAENGSKRKEVKSEPLPDDAQVSEEVDVSFF